MSDDCCPNCGVELTSCEECGVMCLWVSTTKHQICDDCQEDFDGDDE